MLTPQEFRDLVSGRRRGVKAALARALLRIVEVPYAMAVGWRNRRYDKGRAEIRHVGVPVISVGNLTLGGTGKTPVVKWLARWLAERGQRGAIVSRGYGASAGRKNDEAMELEQALPGVPHIQNPNRVAAAERAVQEFHGDVILADDGFQHRRLARDLDIVLLDALEPFGYDHVFPRGTLREPVAGLRRAQIVCLSRADVIDASQREDIRRRVAKLAPQAVWCELIHSASSLINSAGQSLPLATLAGRRVAAFCGLGNPAGFQHTLAATGCELVAWRAFPDHHSFSPSDISTLTEMAAGSRADFAVCTHKDLVKIDQEHIGEVPLWALAIEMKFQFGQDEFERKVVETLRAASDP